MIREALPAEYGKVAEITVGAYRESAVILVAEVGGELAGALAYYAAGKRDSAWLAPDWAYFRALAVAPGHRGKGIGRALTQACIDRAMADGAAGLGLHTTEVMPVARALYERMGFVQHAEYDGGSWKYWSYVLVF